MVSVEREKLDATHAEIGGYLLGIWGLPSAVVSAVACHHTPQHLSNPELDAVTAVHVADALVREQDAESNGLHSSEIEEEYLRVVGAADRLPEWRESIEEMLNCD